MSPMKSDKCLCKSLEGTPKGFWQDEFLDEQYCPCELGQELKAREDRYGRRLTEQEYRALMFWGVKSRP
jgi:hypothetical protein